MADKQMITSNFLWRFAERCGAEGVTFVVSIVLARLLDPEVYGTVALVTVFTTIMQVFVDSGLGNSLIQKKDADNLDFSTVFFFNVAVCMILYGVMFFSAPLISQFYNRQELTPVIRVLSLILIISGVKNVQQAYVSRHLLFKKFFLATLTGTIGAAILGIWMAWHGYGVWALVAQNLFNKFIDTVILWITVKWRPQLVFSWSRLKVLFSYGWKLLVSKLLDTVYNDLRQLIIGKRYSSESLAFYNRGRQFPQFIVANVNTSIDSVLFPVLSNVQDNKSHVRAMTRRAIRISTYIMAPLMIGLAACGKTVVQILLTEKWLPCVPFMMVFCITFMFQPIHTANLNAIKAMGRSDLFLKLEIIKKSVGLVVLLISMRFGVMAMAYSLLITNVFSQIINSWPNKSLLNYSYLEQIKDILPGILLAVGMGLLVYMVELIGFNKWLTLFIQIPLGMGIYVGGSKVFRLDSYYYIKSILSTLSHKISHQHNK